jgi:hypothetical protein
MTRIKARLHPLFGRTAASAALLILIAPAISGCRSIGKPNSASFASVEIKGRTPTEIRDATVSVFRDDGYSTVFAGTTDLVFEQEGSRMNKVAYGDWVGGSSVYVRVKASIVPLSESDYRLQCTAYMVRNKGTGIEDEVRLANVRSGPYQRLLKKVAGQLK